VVHGNRQNVWVVREYKNVEELCPRRDGFNTHCAAADFVLKWIL